MFSTITGIASSACSVPVLFIQWWDGESLNPFTNSEARGYWLSILGGIFSISTFTTSRHITQLVKNRKVVAEATKKTDDVLQSISLLNSGVSFFNRVVKLFQKEEKKNVVFVLEMLDTFVDGFLLGYSAY